MGTNYYLTMDACPTCGRGEEIHIGKSSWGWCFLLHVKGAEWESLPTDLDGWKALFMEPKNSIRDEYRKVISPKEMLEIITERGRDEKNTWTEAAYRQNDAEPGPKNLVRCRIDGKHCVGHGVGTWDLITGDFS